MLETERLRLVCFDAKYAKELFELQSDYEAIKYTYTPLMTTIDESINFIEHQINRTDKSFQDRFVVL